MSIGNKNATRVDLQGSLLPQLPTAVKGPIITPDDAEYDKARTVFYGGIDRRPSIIVQAADANDVIQVVSTAVRYGMELAVRSGGHSVAGHSVSEGGLVLDLSKMKGLSIDAEQRTAWAEAGLTAGEYATAAAAHGLATGFGDTASVGIGGLTLGGGVGYLVRKYGLTIDDLLAAEIVTANGQLLHVDAGHYSDLFWAIRGGGGNFGVVTRFQFRLHKLDTIVGGLLVLPANPDLIRSFVAEAEAAPDELSTIANVVTAPPLPFLPAEYHGQLITMATLVYAGEADAGARAIAPFRALATPIADMVRPIRYPEIYPPEPENYHPVAAARTMFIDVLNQQAAEVIFKHLRASSAQMAATQIRVLGGAMARVPDEATAFAHRTRRIMMNVAALYQRPDETAHHEAWVNAFAAELSQGKPGAYVNFLGDEGEARVHEAYPDSTWERLAKIKARYDPTNLFRLNQNILPAVSSR